MLPGDFSAAGEDEADCFSKKMASVEIGNFVREIANATQSWDALDGDEAP